MNLKTLHGSSVRLRGFRTGIATLLLICTALLTPASAVFFSASIDPDLYGDLDQGNVPGIEGCACGPTSVVNSLVYLQNVAADIYGDNTLVPHSQDPIPQEDMADVATILAGEDYMDTGNNDGTFIEDFIYGKVKYIEERAPGKTRYAARARHWTKEDCEAHEKMGFHQGWGIATDQLAALVAKI